MLEICIKLHIIWVCKEKNKLLEGGIMESEDSLYIMWTRMLKIREK